ncbi:hypothetical protein [Carnobacterium pleistocenium]|uniref:hypothetical protein n=1 Tax=Carnobacterium pleistocenium TaxID=181073 RepID=UPI00055680D8|nr:hypothetical protein [Carnobacterium pleistocenium]
MAKTFAIYKDEELLTSGTAKECAGELNVKVETIWHYKSATYQKKVSGKNRRIAIELEEAE